jgi:hypothetical protein
MREGHDYQVAVVKTRGGRKGNERRRVNGLSCCDALGPALCMNTRGGMTPAAAAGSLEQLDQLWSR